jgi:geranylgeranyl diphosphate synthase type II
MPTSPGGLDGRDGTGDRDVPAWVAARRGQIETLLAARVAFEPDGEDPGRLVEAMRYSLLAPGKRLRPILALAAAEAAGDIVDGAVHIAAASVELIHCYSLIHDDLPAMDDDDMRRGKPSNHKVFGEAIAILAGDGLLTMAFAWLAEAGAQAGRARAFGRAAAALARGAGASGMVRGQARDLTGSAPTTLAALERLHLEKTAALFRAAVEVGAAAAGADEDDIEALGAFGERFGIAFQHADDLDDGDHPAHADTARSRLGHLVAEALAALERLRDPRRAAVLRGLAQSLLAKAPTGQVGANATATMTTTPAPAAGETAAAPGASAGTDNH